MSDYIVVFFFFPFYFESHAHALGHKKRTLQIIKFNNPDLRQVYFMRRRDNKARARVDSCIVCS